MGNMCLSLALAILPRGAPARAEMGVLSVESGSWQGGKSLEPETATWVFFLLFAPRSEGFHTKMIVANGGFCSGGGGIVGQQRLWQAAQTKGSKGDINGFLEDGKSKMMGKQNPDWSLSPPQFCTFSWAREKHRKELKKIQRGWEITGVVKLCFCESSPLKRKSGHRDTARMVYDMYHIHNIWDSWPHSSLLFLLGDLICALLDKADPPEKVVRAQGCQAQSRWGLLQWLNLLITSASSFYFSGVPARNTVQSNQDPDPIVISKIWVWLGLIWDQTPE